VRLCNQTYDSLIIHDPSVVGVFYTYIIYMSCHVMSCHVMLCYVIKYDDYYR